MNSQQVLILARKHLGQGNEASARFCLEHAVWFQNEGNFDYAKRWALKALDYSVGFMHQDYKSASA
jgi:hypothetical protein